MTTPVISPRPSAQPQPHPADAPVQRADPCTMVILGALGDLSRRKLIPAIYELMREHLTNEHFAVLGVARDPQTDDTFRDKMREALAASDEVKRVDDELWQTLCKRLYYVAADAADPSGSAAFAARLV